MSNTARNATESEFWRPPLQQTAPPAAQSDACARCGTEFVAGSRFCHLCGSARDPRMSRAPRLDLRRFLDWTRFKAGLGLSTASLIAFVAGIVCLLAAILTGLVYNAATVLDWQAVQFWRSEWLLAAIAAFLAGGLLKRTA